MITLQKGQENTVVLTLTEMSVIGDYNYLLRFQNKETNVYSYCLLGEDLSANTQRSNEFEITDQDDPDPLESQVNLSVGEYYYEAYQLTDEQVEELDLETIDVEDYVLVEGPCKMRVYKDEVINTAYTGPLTNAVYEQE